MINVLWERADALATEKALAVRDQLQTFVNQEITDGDVRQALVAALFPGSPGTLSGWWQGMHDEVAGKVYTRLVKRIVDSAGV